MSPFATMLIYTTASGFCIMVGGWLARFERIQSRWLEQELRHSVIAFGGGILIAAVALVLVPEGKEYVGSPVLIVADFLAGGLFFMLFERYLSSRQTQLPQTLAMLLDYVPESLAMGGLFALGEPSAPLLALLIGLQNLPEGFNAFRELTAVKTYSARRILLLMTVMVFLGPLAGIAGWSLAADSPEILGHAMLFASGGILYLIFQDIAPQARLERHWAPTFGAVLGFCFCMLAEMSIGVS